MSYKSRFGITDIKRSKYDNFSISYDCQDPNSKRGRRPVFLFTPDMDKTIDHYHIVLNKRQAKVLSKWLSDYLK